jgi:hypothetical protein
MFKSNTILEPTKVLSTNFNKTSEPISDEKQQQPLSKLDEAKQPTPDNIDLNLLKLSTQTPALDIDLSFFESKQHSQLSPIKINSNSKSTEQNAKKSTKTQRFIESLTPLSVKTDNSSTVVDAYASTTKANKAKTSEKTLEQVNKLLQEIYPNNKANSNVELIDFEVNISPTTSTSSSSATTNTISTQSSSNNNGTIKSRNNEDNFSDKKCN